MSIPFPYRNLHRQPIRCWLRSWTGGMERWFFHFEPGRWVVAPAGLLLTRVNTVKDQGRITFLGTDTGFNHLLRPAMYESYHAVVNVTRAAEPSAEEYTIAGNICETGDILAEDRMLPQTHSGDLLALCDAGAYGMTMASNYNPAVHFPQKY